MAEKMELKEFYEATFPTEDSLLDFYKKIKLTKSFAREAFLETTNTAFAILGHFSGFDFSQPFSRDVIFKKYALLVSIPTLERFTEALQKLKILDADWHFNPSVIPMIQRYDKIFSEYEKQNGLTNPCARTRR